MDMVRAPAAADVNPAGKRDQRIDFLRGLALIFIFVDHVPDSLLSLLTLKSYAFADAAELFFFLSGFVSAMVYGRALETKGIVPAAVRIWRRAWVIYVAQILLFGLLIGEVSLGVAGTGHAGYEGLFRIEDFLTRPGAATVHALLLHYQPAYLDILPVYVLLLVAFPLVLLALARNVWLVLVPSFALYAAVQASGLTPATFPNGNGWFFNPLAWQFLFVLGAVFGHPSRKPAWVFLESGWLAKVALAVAASIAAIRFPEALRTIWPHIPSLSPFALPLDKASLEPLRIVSFLALALAASRYMPPAATFRRSRLARLTIRCGKHSLHIFCLGVLLAVASGIVAEETGHSPVVQLLVCIAGIAVLFGYASYLEGLRRTGRLLLPFPLRRGQPA